MTVRVLHILEAIEGGTARHLTDLVRHLDGVEHYVAVPERRVGGATDAAALEALQRSSSVAFVRLQRSASSPENALATVEVTNLVRRVRPSVVHGHSSIGGVAARLAGRIMGTPSVYTPNGIRPTRGALMVERALGPLTGRFIAVSESEAAMALQCKLVAPARIRVIPNGIDLTPPQPKDLRARLAVPPETPLVRSIARLLPQKRPLTFVSTAARIAESRPDVHFVLVGSGEMEGEVKAAIDAEPSLLRRFHLVPSLPEASAYLPSLDVFLLLSGFEGAPYTPLEAMRAGVPVVVTDVIGSRDAVETGRSGVVVPVGDAATASRETLTLLADARRRGQLVERATARLRDLFDVRLMAQRTGQVYEELRGARRRCPACAARSTTRSANRAPISSQE